MVDIESLKRLIDDYEIISFDIFDTLLLRPYLEPTDLFLHIENHFECKDFCSKRILAETNARALLPHKKEDVSLSEIYEQMPEALQKYQQIECDWELMTLFKNPEISELYDYALEQGKKIIIISDMYLPKDLIKNILEKNDYNYYEKLYLSSEIKKVKYTGSLYRFAVEDLDISPNQIFHIGDNRVSDFEKATALGLRAFHYPQVKKRLFERDSRIKELYYSIKDADIKLDISILAMMSAVYDLGQKHTFWQKIGYKFAGSIVYSFAKWIEQRLLESNINNVGFVARDGYFLNKVMGIINPQINSQYIYASRKVIENVKKDRNLMDKYKKYLEDKCLLGSGAAAFVDVRTEFFSVQRFLSQFAPSSLGLYWMVGSPQNITNYQSFYKYSLENDENFLMSELVEFFMSSPEMPLETLIVENNELKPVYTTLQLSEELYRTNVISEMGTEIIKFATDIKKIFSSVPILQNPHSIILWNNIYLSSPTEEENTEFSKICHSSNQEHDRYISILKLKDIKSYQMYIKALKHFAKKI